MRLTRKIILKFAASAIGLLIVPLVLAAQSTDVNFPTALTNNEIEGTIRARDIGDSRLTSYFYAFDGGQGDVFINVLTKNFTGDIDVFTAEGLRPLTKMVIYSDAGESETGRLVYMRKLERLILRIEGRSPNDDPATFRIKFAGSFIVLVPQKSQSEPAIKRSEVDADSGIRVNSVGTIVEVLPKAQPPVKENSIVKDTVAADENRSASSANKLPKKAEKVTPTTPRITEVTGDRTNPPLKPFPVKKREVVEEKDSTPATGKGIAAPEVKTVFKKPSKPKAASTAKKPTPAAKPPPSLEVKNPDPLASIHLVVMLKDGEIVSRPMNEVLKFSVDNGVLTVIAKDGRTTKYSIFDVAKVTIE